MLALLCAQLHMVVRTKFEVADVLRAIAEQVQKGMKIFGGGVVRARRANDIQGLQTLLCFELWFDRAQGINLAGNANHRQAFMPLCQGRFHQAQQRPIAHAHASALRHVAGLRDHHWAWFPSVVRISGSGNDCVDHAK